MYIPYLQTPFVISKYYFIISAFSVSPPQISKPIPSPHGLSSPSLFPNTYTPPQARTFPPATPIAAPRTHPLAPNCFPILAPKLPVARRRLASSRYKPDHAAVNPAASILNEDRLRYVLKSRTGGKTMGSVRKGRKCNAVMNVARRVGGKGDTIYEVH